MRGPRTAPTAIDYSVPQSRYIDPTSGTPKTRSYQQLRYGSGGRVFENAECYDPNIHCE